MTLSDPEGELPENLDAFDPINNRDDLLKLLIATQISFGRDTDSVTAYGPIDAAATVQISNGNELDAAALAAVRLAASWVPQEAKK
ncbi:hypothetical protein [Paraburkholderia sp. BL10I2N1]|uniref:hypothetical protein n=1 Tax=Paraburkholderia sp. BL10I2N1 TaxID=1938796 RepID=UPI00105B828D|nr:hypothetical protein [Paraburkholderia sp. BL10I2N1]TDN58957.1 hypothetical protein B0G77_8138 [Paraburkholderia sp. BL10I2N1]